jgi:Secretion system C-terminal sorting domain
MKKLILLLLSLSTTLGFAQTKSSGTVSLQPDMTANFTLNNTTSQVTLVLTGPSDRWFGIGIGVSSGFGMASGDVLVYTSSLTDRKFVGFGGPSTDASQDWTTVSNNVSGLVRTLTLTRALTNSDSAGTVGADFQMPYASTNSFSIVGVRASSATTALGGHGGNPSAGYATATFTALGVEDFSLNSSSIAPNPSSNGSFTVKSKIAIENIDIYSQTGAFIKTVKVDNASNTEVNVDGLSTGVYLVELKNKDDKSWKKVIIE